MNRRSALTLGASVGLAGLAGCLEGLNGNDSPHDDESDIESADGYSLDDLARWIPQPNSLDANPVTVTAMAPAALAAEAGDAPLGFGPGNQITDQPIELPEAEDIDLLAGARYGNMSMTTNSGGVLAIDGTLDVDAASESLEAGGFERDTTVRGYECYTDGTYAWGLGSETFLAASFPERPMDGLRQVIDAEAGETARLVEEREPFHTLAASQPAGTVIFAEHATGSVTPVMQGNRSDAVLATGESFDVHAEETTITTTLVFASADEATEAHLETYVAESDGVDQADATYRLDGVVGEIDVTRPTDKLL